MTREPHAALAREVIRRGKSVVRFTIPGPLLGYRASIRRAFDPKYRAFKDRVRLLANAAGIPRDLDRDAVARVDVRIYWKRRARIDRKNVLGAIEDGLFTKDRRVLRGICDAFENNAAGEYALVAFNLEII